MRAVIGYIDKEREIIANNCVCEYYVLREYDHSVSVQMYHEDSSNTVNPQDGELLAR
jgi:hypothetical protein